MMKMNMFPSSNNDTSILARFYRGDPCRNRTVEGTALGLSLA